MPDPIHVASWIRAQGASLVPPVGHGVMWRDDAYEVLVVRGPNTRTDFHINSTPELFYQLRGDLVLRLRRGDRVVDQRVRQGQLVVLPAGVPHAPQRGQDTWGIVVEQRGASHTFVWYCAACGRERRRKTRGLDSLTQLDDVLRGAPTGVCEACAASRL